ncbi:MAG: HNH endonuclease [Mesorhizobium sp.]|nr:MAG: HNH endonuclease [Mesorhizobium sp.]
MRSKADRERHRGNSISRGYDAAWRRLRAWFLAAQPKCSHPGCVDQANEVDHVLSVRTHPHLRLVWGNLRSLCKHHYSQCTARDQGFARSGQ